MYKKGHKEYYPSHRAVVRIKWQIEVEVPEYRVLHKCWFPISFLLFTAVGTRKCLMTVTSIHAIAKGNIQLS